MENKDNVIYFSSVQPSSFPQSCLTLRNPMDHSMPDLPVHHQLPDFTQSHLHWVVMPSSVIPVSSCPQSFPASGSFQISHNYSAIIILMLITEVGKSLGENALLFAQIDVFWLQAHSTKMDRFIWGLRPISSFPERNHNEDVTFLLRIWGKWLSAGEPGLLK